MSGYIKLHRGWRECEVFNDEPFSEREAWVWLIENAAWKDTARRTPHGGIVSLERGQIHVSLASLSSAWSWSIKRVRGFLSRLEKGHMIGHKKGTARGTATTILTICNYDKYQGEGQGQGTVEGDERARSGHTQEESKEDKEDKKDKRAHPRAVIKPDCVSDRVWADFLALRRAKRAPLTETALGMIEKEAAKAGWALHDALAECIVRGWQSFKAEWVAPSANNVGTYPPEHSGVPL